MKKVLFLCTGNSCRSQMAEAIVNARFADEWQAVSAGTRPAGFVHPKAVEALSEIGIQHEGRSKRADETDLCGTKYCLRSTLYPSTVRPTNS
jgi:arsenate reductase